MRTLLGVTLGYAIFAFGGAEGSAQFVLSLLVSSLLVLLTWRLVFDPTLQLNPTSMWLPMGLFLIGGIAQLIPWPQEVVAVLSPGRLAPFEPVREGEAIPALLPISAVPGETRHALRLGMLAAAMLMVTTACVRTKRDVESILVSVFGLGCLEALLAVVQIATGASRIYGMVDPGEQGMMTAGSFVNHSHFSQLVNLTIGAGVGLLLVRMNSSAEGGYRVPTSGASMTNRNGWILAGLALSAFAVCLSLSRAGILSLVMAMGITGSLVMVRQRTGRHGWMLLSVVLAAFGLLLLFGLEEFTNRLATLGQPGAYDDRWQLTMDSLAAGTDAWIVGTGLGTYGYVFPAYDTTGSTSIAPYADNDYAQLFVETGVVGVAILLMACGLLVRELIRCLRCRHSPTAQAAWGLMLGLIAIGIQSATDFGQRLPGVFLVTLTLVGVLSRLPQVVCQPAASSSLRRPWRGLGGWGVRLTGATLVAMAMAWVVEGAYAHFQAERWWATARECQRRLEQVGWEGTDQEFAELLVAAENGVAWEPDNARAQFHLNLIRWLSVSRSTEIAPRRGDLSENERLIVGQIVHELAAVRRLAPSFAAPYLLEGQLRSYVLGDILGGGELIYRATRLDNRDPQVQFHYGEWSAHFGSPDVAKCSLHRAVVADRRFFESSARLLIDELNDLATVKAWAGGDRAHLEVLVRMLEARPNHARQLSELRAESEQLLRALARRGEASAAQLVALGSQAASSGDHKAAEAYYRQALSIQFHLPPARLGLAEIHRARGEFHEAMEEVRTCLRYDPQNSQARRLAESLALELPTSASDR